jgi:hypothetical protein
LLSGQLTKAYLGKKNKKSSQVGQIHGSKRQVKFGKKNTLYSWANFEARGGGGLKLQVNSTR